MKKFNILIGLTSVVINANEYTVWPKTNNFTAADGHECAFTSGKGKSVVNNHYIYFKHEGTIFYFKSNPQQIADAKEHFEAAVTGAKTDAEVAAPAPIEAAPAPVETPKRRRVAKA